MELSAHSLQKVENKRILWTMHHMSVHLLAQGEEEKEEERNIDLNHARACPIINY